VHRPDDASTHAGVKQLFDQNMLKGRFDRIKLIFRSETGHIFKKQPTLL